MISIVLQADLNMHERHARAHNPHIAHTEHPRPAFHHCISATSACFHSPVQSRAVTPGSTTGMHGANALLR